MSTKIISTFLTVIFLFNAVPPTRGFETDQYNLPPKPLADIGDEVTEYVAGQVRLAAAKINARIAAEEACLLTPDVGKWACGSRQELRKELEHLRSEPAVAKAVYDLLSGGHLMTTKFGKWIHAHKFRAQPASYKAPYLESIYLIKPSNYLTLSPTIRMYGHEFGIDKLEHMFQQGHQYYERVNNGLSDGKSISEAELRAVEWGKRTERTYYGILTSGVYSNADLAANHVGLRFYRGLTRSVNIGGVSRPPMIILRDGRWYVADDAVLKSNLLKPFVDDHLNEAYNPSAFRLPLEGPVRRSVKRNSCADWKKAFPDLTASQLSAHALKLELWNGEIYGHTKRRGFVKIGELCLSSGL